MIRAAQKWLVLILLKGWCDECEGVVTFSISSATDDLQNITSWDLLKVPGEHKQFRFSKFFSNQRDRNLYPKSESISNHSIARYSFISPLKVFSQRVFINIFLAVVVF